MNEPVEIEKKIKLLYAEAVDLYKRIHHPSIFSTRQILTKDELQNKFKMTVKEYIDITKEKREDVIKQIEHDCFDKSINFEDNK